MSPESQHKQARSLTTLSQRKSCIRQCCCFMDRFFYRCGKIQSRLMIYRQIAAIKWQYDCSFWQGYRKTSMIVAVSLLYRPMQVTLESSKFQPEGMIDKYIAPIGEQ